MLFFYLIEDNASPVQLVSFFFLFFFISSLCTRAFSERGKNVVAVIDAHSACLSVWDKWCAYLFFFFFHYPLFRFPPFWTAKDLYSDSCFAYDIALPWVTQCLFFYHPLLEFHFSKFTVKAIGAPSSKSVVRH